MDHDVLCMFEEFQENYNPIEPDENLSRITERKLAKISFDKNTKPLITKVNKVLSSKLTQPLSMTDLHTLICCGAKTVLLLCKQENIPVYEQIQIPKVFPAEEKDQKHLLDMSPKLFRRLLFSREKITSKSEIPMEEELLSYWSDKVWERESSFDEKEAASFIKQEAFRLTGISTTSPSISLRDLKRGLKRKLNWSPAGVDGVQTFWYKKFTSTHGMLLEKINQIIRGEEEMPVFFTQGFSELFPKSEDTKSPDKYRPITHLPAIYNIITRCIYEKIFAHYKDKAILPNEQCGGRRGYYGYKRALTIDSVALDQKTVWGCYVDFYKAFDMVPHSWILRMLHTYHVDDTLVNFLERTMASWKTRLYLSSGAGILTKSIQLKRGIFQGDSLSVLLYWTAISPMSFALNALQVGLRFPKGGLLTHLLYMDDLKLYSSEFKDLELIFEEVERFSKATSMKINYEKSHVFSIPDQPRSGQSHRLPYAQQDLFLGYQQTPKINHEDAIGHKIKSFEKQYDAIEKTKFSQHQKEMLKTMFLVPSIVSTFGVLHWKNFGPKLLDLCCNRRTIHPVALKQLKQYVKPEHIYLKLFEELHKMRLIFLLDESKLMAMTVENDTVTPLKLSLTNHTAYIQHFVGIVINKR